MALFSFRIYVRVSWLYFSWLYVRVSWLYFLSGYMLGCHGFIFFLVICECVMSLGNFVFEGRL